jgi:hypothetical protein
MRAFFSSARAQHAPAIAFAFDVEGLRVVQSSIRCTDPAGHL